MSQDELARLQAEEAELQRRMEELKQKRLAVEADEKAKREEAQRQQELEKEVVVFVRQLTGGSILIESDARSDLIELWKATPGRAFRGYADPYKKEKGRNLIPVKEWDGVLAKLADMPNVEVEWARGVKEELEWWLNAPPWEVVVHPSRRHFLAKQGPRQSGYHIFSHIPGSDWDGDSKSWKIPMSEGWRIAKALEGIEGVVYEDGAAKVIFHQVKQRDKLNEIARKEDSDAYAHILTREVEVRGVVDTFWNHMKKFQRVGVEFGVATGYRYLNGDDTGLGKTWQGLALAEIMRHEQEEAGEAFQCLVALKAANIPNWRREVERLTGEKPIVVRGGTPDGWDLMRISQKEVKYVLISYDTLGLYQTEEKEDGREERLYTWAKIFLATKPDILLMDEAHMIKNPDANRSQAARMLAPIQHIVPLTASPVLNRTEEIWPLLHMLNPHIFKYHSQFLDTYTFGGKRARNVGQLHELLRPMFLRRKKSDVQKDLPPINRITRFVDLTDDARKRYEEVLAGIYHELETFDPTGGGAQKQVMGILAQITRLKQVCADDKLDYVTDLGTELADEKEGKGLIFSQWKGTAYGIARRLGHEAVCTVRPGEPGAKQKFISLDAEARDKLFEDARHDPEVRFVVTTEAAKEGHNLEFCDWVLFNDLLWTPGGHAQCEGRAYGRLSDPHPIDSFYIVADVDIERWIMEMLDKKLAIIEETVEGVESSRDAHQSVGMELIRRMKEAMWRR